MESRRKNIMFNVWSKSLKENLVSVFEMDELGSGVTERMYSAGGLDTGYGYYNGTIEKGFEGIIGTCIKNNSVTSSGNFIRRFSTPLYSINSGVSGVDRPFSYNIWIKYISNAANHGWLIAKRDPVEYQTVIYTTNLDFYIYGNTGSNYLIARMPVSNLNLQTNTWYMITSTYDGSKSANGMNIYLNSVKLACAKSMVGNYQGVVYDANANVLIGNFLDQLKPNAYIDQIAFWQKELSQSDVNELYNYGKGKKYI